MSVVHTARTPKGTVGSEGKRTGRTVGVARPAKVTTKPSTQRETEACGHRTVMLQWFNRKSWAARPSDALRSRYGWLGRDGLVDHDHHDRGHSGNRCFLASAMNMPRA